MDRLRELVGEYFDLGYAEGAAGRDTDTMAGDAQRVLSEINELIEAAESRVLSLEEALREIVERAKAASSGGSSAALSGLCGIENFARNALKVNGNG